MPGNLELLKAFELFGDAMQDFNQASAVRQINERLGDLTAQERAVTQQLESARADIGTTPTPEQREGIENLQQQATGFLDQRKSLAGQATRRLTALGLPVAQTQAVAQSIFQGPSAVELQLEGQLELQERGFAFKREQAALDRPAEIAEGKAKTAAAQSERAVKFFDTFQKRNSNTIEALDSANRARTLVQNNNLGAAIGIVTTMLVRASGDVRPSDKDIERIELTQDVKGLLKRGAFRKAFNEMTPEEKENALSLLTTMESNITKILNDKAASFSKNRSRILGVEEDVFRQQLLDDVGLTPTEGGKPSIRDLIFEGTKGEGEEIRRGGTIPTGTTPTEAATFNFQ